MRSPFAVTKEDLKFWKILLTIFRSAWQHFPGILIGFLSISVVSAVLFVAAPKLLQVIIDTLVQRSAPPWNLVVIFTACLLGSAVFKFAASKLNFYLATKIEDRWRYASLHHYYTLPFSWHDQHDSGEIGNRLDKGGAAIFVIIHELMGSNIFVPSLTLLFIFAYLTYSYPLFAFVLILPIPLYVLVTYIISKRIAAGQAHLNELSDISNRTLFDGVANVRTVKAFGKDAEETKNYASKWDGYHSFEYGVEKLWFIQDFLQSLIEITMRGAVLAYCVYATYTSRITLGELTLVLSYQQMTFMPLVQLNSLFTRLARNVKRVSHMFSIVSEEDTLKEKDAVPARPLRRDMSLKDVHFHYGGSAHALHGIDLKIPAGTTTALVGRSGAGKSTLALLLMRFYDPQVGTIRWDGTDLRNIKRQTLRRHATWIPQDTSLFNRTIRENIAYGDQKASQADIEAAARRAHAHEFILEMPKGYDSVIGERGVRLSGGQRQRIAIARALLTRPSLLVMDESTSHLDSETEKAISESIQKLHHKTTQVIIAHRLSTILHADQIVVLDKGKIVGVGKHRELLTNPIYRTLYRLQFHGDE